MRASLKRGEARTSNDPVATILLTRMLRGITSLTAMFSIYSPPPPPQLPPESPPLDDESHDDELEPLS